MLQCSQTRIQLHDHMWSEFRPYKNVSNVEDLNGISASVVCIHTILQRAGRFTSFEVAWHDRMDGGRGARMVPLRMALADDAMHQVLGWQGRNIFAVFPLRLNRFFHIQFIVGRNQRQFTCAFDAKETNPIVTATVKTGCKTLQKNIQNKKIIEIP